LADGKNRLPVSKPIDNRCLRKMFTPTAETTALLCQFRLLFHHFLSDKT
jgi:hypothetical protein